LRTSSVMAIVRNVALYRVGKACVWLPARTGSARAQTRLGKEKRSAFSVASSSGQGAACPRVPPAEVGRALRVPPSCTPPYRAGAFAPPCTPRPAFALRAMAWQALATSSRYGSRRLGHCQRGLAPWNPRQGVSPPRHLRATVTAGCMPASARAALDPRRITKGAFYARRQ
jgi:hypothetical protein